MFSENNTITITKQEFTDAVNSGVQAILAKRFNSKDPEIEYKDLVRAHLKLWAESNIPAPENELQSIQAWLRFSGSHTKEEIQNAMRKRMVLLMEAAQEVYDEGPEEEDRLGIYDNRPEMDRGR